MGLPSDQIDPNTQELVVALGDLNDSELFALYEQVLGYEFSPVPVIEFVNNTDYLGNHFKNRLYPIWETALQEIYPNPYLSPYNEIIFTGSIGCGKTTAAVVGSLYDLYKILLLSDPHSIYSLIPSTRIVFHIFSATLSLGDDIIWSQINDILMNSPFFSDRLKFAKTNKLDTLFPRKIDFSVGSRFTHALGSAVFEAILDEMNFQSVVSEQAYKNYNAITRRRQSRFMQKGGSLPGHSWLISSSDTKASFLESHINKSKDNTGTKTYCHSIWDAHAHKGIYSGAKFSVFIGDQFRDPCIIDGPSDYPPDLIIEVPVEYRNDFEKDIVSALKDLAGLSIGRGSHKLFNSVSKILSSQVFENLWKKDVIDLSFWEDTDEVKDYFDLDRYLLRRSHPNLPRFIHIDTGISGDKLGIACCYVPGFTNISKFDSVLLNQSPVREPIIHVEWAVGIQAKPGEEIPLFKVRKFIIQDLFRNKVPIRRVTTDGYQSTDMRQMLKKSGIDAELLSVDRTMDPYIAFRNAVYEDRCLLPKSQYLNRELRELEIDYESGKVDHPVNGSKDISDGAAGCVFASIQSKLRNKDMVSELASHIDTILPQKSLYDKIKSGDF